MSTARKPSEILSPSQEGEVIPPDELEAADDLHILDMASQAIIQQQRIRLANNKGDWIKPQGLLGSPDPEVFDPDSDDDEESVKEEDTTSQDLYRSFVTRASRIPRLSEEEEEAYGIKVREFSDDDAAKKLVFHNMRLAIKMAHQYRRSWANLMDLVQEASTGMAIAAKKWDPDKGTRFGTYAAYWIRAQLTRFLMLNGRLIHTGNTRAGRKLYFSLPKVRRKLLAEGKSDSIENIAAEVGESLEEVTQVVQRLEAREASLSSKIGGDDSGQELQDMIANEDDDPEMMAAQLELTSLIKGMVVGFSQQLESDRDRDIWTKHLVTHDPTSLVELGKKYGVSKQRMGQLANRLKKQFRCYIIDQLGPHTQLSWLFDN
jgi:RNA polymerase sigma-32 factor